MPSLPSIAGVLRPVSAAARLAIAALSLLPALAVADVALYQATVPLQGLTAADRTAGFGDALRIAAVRASGRRDAATNPVVAAAASDPSRYVQQYSTTSDRMLKVGFDGRGVEQLLQQAGLPLWPAERPVTLVELFVPSVAGGARAVLAAEHPPERDQIDRAAQARGLPIAWPQQAVNLDQARARVSAPGGASQAVLLGILGSGSGDWSFGHTDLRSQGQGRAPAGVDLAADALASRYAPASTQGVNTVPVCVGGVPDIQSYAGLLEYLQTLSLVRAIAVEELSGSNVCLKLSVRGDLDLLRRIAALDTHLQTGAKGGGAPGSEGTDFTWQP